MESGLKAFSPELNATRRLVKEEAKDLAGSAMYHYRKIWSLPRYGERDARKLNDIELGVELQADYYFRRLAAGKPMDDPMSAETEPEALALLDELIESDDESMWDELFSSFNDTDKLSTVENADDITQWLKNK